MFRLEQAAGGDEKVPMKNTKGCEWSVRLLSARYVMIRFQCSMLLPETFIDNYLHTSWSS